MSGKMKPNRKTKVTGKISGETKKSLLEDLNKRMAELRKPTGDLLLAYRQKLERQAMVVHKILGWISKPHVSELLEKPKKNSDPQPSLFDWGREQRLKKIREESGKNAEVLTELLDDLIERIGKMPGALPEQEFRELLEKNASKRP